MNIFRIGEEMKEVLKYLNVSWAQRDQVEVHIGDHVLIFSYKGKEVRVTNWWDDESE